MTPNSSQPTPSDVVTDSSSLLNLLVRAGEITVANEAVLKRFMNKWQVSAYEAILETAVMSETQLADALGELLKIDRLFHVRTLAVHEESLIKLGFKRAREWMCLVVKTPTRERADLVIADPTCRSRIDRLKQEFNCEMTLAVAERSDIVEAIDELFPLSAQLPSLYLK